MLPLIGKLPLMMIVQVNVAGALRLPAASTASTWKV